MGPSSILTAVDLAGLLLALLDFLNLRARLEHACLAFRNWTRGWVGFVRDDRNLAFNLVRGWRSILLGMGREALVIAYTLACLVAFGNGPRMLELVQSVPSAWLWMLVAASPLILLLFHVIVMRAIVGTAFMAFAELVWRVFWLLGRPRAGVIGTLGLALALSSTLGDALISRFG